MVVRLGRDGVHRCSVYWRQHTAVVYRHGWESARQKQKVAFTWFSVEKAKKNFFNTPRCSNITLIIVFGGFCLFLVAYFRLAMDRTGRRHPTEERTQSRLETSAGETVRVPKSGAQVVRVLLENESTFLGLDHVSRWVALQLILLLMIIFNHVIAPTIKIILYSLWQHTGSPNGGQWTI